MAGAGAAQRLPSRRRAARRYCSIANRPKAPWRSRCRRRAAARDPGLQATDVIRPQPTESRSSREPRRGPVRRRAPGVGAAARTHELVLGLPTGRTPILLYDVLARLTAARTSTLAGDDVQPRRVRRHPPDHPGSYRWYMEQHLFRRVNIDPGAHQLPRRLAPIPDAECARYERAIAAAGGIDLQILGIGANGHIGFNEPGRELAGAHASRDAAPETRRSNAALFGGDPPRCRPRRCRWGWGRSCRRAACCCWCTGERRPTASSGWSTGR